MEKEQTGAEEKRRRASWVQHKLVLCSTNSGSQSTLAIMNHLTVTLINQKMTVFLVLGLCLKSLAGLAVLWVLSLYSNSPRVKWKALLIIGLFQIELNWKTIAKYSQNSIIGGEYILSAKIQIILSDSIIRKYRYTSLFFSVDYTPGADAWRERTAYSVHTQNEHCANCTGVTLNIILLWRSRTATALQNLVNKNFVDLCKALPVLRFDCSFQFFLLD